jgi:hypothetical protein
VKSKLHVVEVVEAGEVASSLQLPEHVQLSLAGIAGRAREGLLALAVRTGLSVLHEAMEWEVDRIVGPKGKHDRERAAKRHGRTAGEVTLGGRRAPIDRPRVRTADDTEEIPLASYQEFASRDLLGQVMLERMLAGVSTRRCRRVDEPVGEQVRTEARSTSKSAVSRAFVAKTRTALSELLGRDLSELELAVVVIDGIDLADVTHVVALGITTDGTKVPLSRTVAHRHGRPAHIAAAQQELGRPVAGFGGGDGAPVAQDPSAGRAGGCGLHAADRTLAEVSGSRPNANVRRGIELAIRVAAPALDLILLVGDGASRVLHPGDRGYSLARVPHEDAPAPRGPHLEPSDRQRSSSMSAR